MDITGTEITVIRGDLEPPLEFTLKRNGVAVDLTGTTVTVEAINRNGSPIDRTATIYNAKGGVIRVILTTSDTATLGVFFMYLTVLHPGDRPETFPTKRIKLIYRVVDK